MDSQILQAIVGENDELFVEIEEDNSEIELSEKGEALWSRWELIAKTWSGTANHVGNKTHAKSLFLASSKYSPETELVFRNKNTENDRLVKLAMKKIALEVIKEKIAFHRGVYEQGNEFLVKSHKMGVACKIQFFFNMNHIRIVPLQLMPWFKGNELSLVKEIRPLLKSHGYCNDAVTAGATAANQKLTSLQLSDAHAHAHNSNEITLRESEEVYKVWKALVAAEAVQRKFEKMRGIK